MNVATLANSSLGRTRSDGGKRPAQNYCIFLICFSLLIVLWGAFVRISGSGDGCGEHWPLCHGSMMPSDTLASLIEFIHRASSGIYLLCGFALPIVVAKLTPKSHLARYSAYFFATTVVIEALIGAILVLGGLVGENSSPLRAIVMGAHLVNTLILFAALVTTWRLLSFEKPKLSSSTLHISVVVLLGFYVVTTIFGGFAALASSLFPAQSLSHGLEMDILGSHILLQLRAIHPLLGFGFVFAALYFFSQRSGLPVDQTKFAMGIIATHIFFGVVMFLSLSPVWMKLVHLFLVEVTWMYLIALVIPIFVRDQA